MICTNCLSPKHQACSCPLNRGRIEVHLGATIWKRLDHGHIDVENGSMLRRTSLADPVVTKGGDNGR